MEKLKSAWVFFVRCLLATMYFMATNSHVLTVFVVLGLITAITVFCIWPATFIIALLSAMLGILYVIVHRVVKHFLSGGDDLW